MRSCNESYAVAQPLRRKKDLVIAQALLHRKLLHDGDGTVRKLWASTCGSLAIALKKLVATASRQDSISEYSIRPGVGRTPAGYGVGGSRSGARRGRRIAGLDACEATLRQWLDRLKYSCLGHLAAQLEAF